MNVEELIRRLKTHDPKARVVIHSTTAPQSTWTNATYVAAKEATPFADGYNPPADRNQTTVRTVLIA